VVTNSYKTKMERTSISLKYHMTSVFMSHLYYKNVSLMPSIGGRLSGDLIGLLGLKFFVSPLHMSIILSVLR
jgi:hypothetical protein